MPESQLTHTTKDVKGGRVRVGSVVRVLSIHASVLVPLEESDRDLVSSMLHECFEVYEVDQWGRAWVEKWWRESEKNSMSHSLALEPDEMELIANVSL